MTGYVELPRRRTHAGLWLRLLRTLLDELNTPLSQCGSHGRNIRYAWELCGHALRAGQSLWRPYEVLDTPVQLQMLEAAATAMHLIEAGAIHADGDTAKLFSPEPPAEFTNGLRASAAKSEPINYWQRAMQALEAAIAEARHNPEEARSLFRLMSYGQPNPESLEQLRATLAEEGIPPEFLLH
jgi:hypothetical protein